MTYFTDEQITLLLKPIHPNRVLTLKGMSYVEGFDIRAELNRVFGFGRWSEEVTDQQLISETETKTNAGKPAWNVVYRTRVRLTVHAPDGTPVTFYDGAHIGENTHPVRGEAHGIALTASQTYALRRAAINLGDQFGLSLYNKGSKEAIVRWTLVRPEAVGADTDDVPVISAEETPGEPAETISEAPSKPRAPRQSKVEAKTGPLTREQIITMITEASTVDKLRIAFKEAGIAGKLDEAVILSEGTPAEEKTTIREWLFRRNDELSPAKSNADGSTDTGEIPGEGTGNQ